MHCHICKTGDATIHYIENINNNVQEFYICQDCAEKKGITDISPQIKISIMDILSGLIDFSMQPVVNLDLKCKLCGTTYKDFQNDKKTGCIECYDFFNDYIKIIKEKIHGYSEHTGKIPSRFKKEVKNANTLSHLKLNLRKAIVRENYEEAAKIRDMISNIKNLIL